MSVRPKTYIINGDNPSISLTKNDITDYQGFLYYMMGAGGGYTDIQELYVIAETNGSSGDVMTGYIDLETPYNVENISGPGNACIEANVSVGNPSTLKVYFTDDPSNGLYPINIQADAGILYKRKPPLPQASDDFGLTYTSGYFASSLTLVDHPVTPGFTYSYRNQRWQATTITDIRSPQVFPANGEGAVTTDFGRTYMPSAGATGFGGGGFYGISYDSSGGNTGPFGYGSGGSTAINCGFIVLTFIPKDAIQTSDNYFISGNTGTTSSNNSTCCLYSLLGGGGGGAFSKPASGGDGVGSGGGGSGDINVGILDLGATGINLTITGGIGGAGGAAGAVGPLYNPGNAGGNSLINYGSNTIICGNGQGGNVGNGENPPFPYNGLGGAGLYTGGCGGSNLYSTNNETIAISNSLINSYNNYANTPGLSSYGSGSVNPVAGPSGFGYYAGTSGDKDGVGGGGGGFYGGNGAGFGPMTLAESNAKGYGCGGGGGGFDGYGSVNNPGGNGSDGYAILRFFKPIYPYIKCYKITGNTLITNVNNDLRSCTGFWYFINGDGDYGIGRSYLNTGHFLKKEDGVSSINFTNTGGFLTITINFTLLNNKLQSLSLKSTTAQSYANILFYS